MFKKIFGLPPIEDRKMSQNYWARTFRPPRFTKRSDDTYIMYQCGVVSFIAALCFQVLSFISIVFQIEFDLYYFKIALPSENFIVPYAVSFSLYVSTILFTTIIPFFLVKYFYNINPKKVDVAWWNHKMSEKQKNNRAGMIVKAIFLFVIMPFVTFGAFALPLLLMKYAIFENAHSSLLFFMFLSWFNLVIYYGGSSYTILSIAILYRYIGSYSGEISSSSIRKGVQE